MNEKKPQISIVYPSFNGEPYLKKNLDSIKNLTNLDEVELVIVDNNSTDLTIKLIESYKNKIKIKLINKKINIGFAKGCNIGVINASGEFIFITNQDTIFPQNFFESLLNIYRKYKKEKEIIISPALVFNSNKIHYFGAKLHFLGFSYTPNMYKKIPKKHSTFKTLKAAGCSIFMKKNTFLNLNGYDSFFL